MGQAGLCRLGGVGWGDVALTSDTQLLKDELQVGGRPAGLQRSQTDEAFLKAVWAVTGGLITLGPQRGRQTACVKHTLHQTLYPLLTAPC